MTSRLEPSVACDRLYPPGAVFMARTDLHQTRLVGYSAIQLDSVTSMLIGLMNRKTTIRHEAGVGPETLDLFERTGIEVAEEILTYRTEGQARRHAEACIERGGKLMWPYPSPSGWFRDEDQLVSPRLWRKLNAKENLVHWAPQQNLLKQEILSHEALADFEPGGPVCLKAAGDAATGWGYSVFPCSDRPSLDAARSWFAKRRDDVPAILVEPLVEVLRCWCAGLAVSDGGVECFGGAEQVFDSPTKQCGSRIDPAHPFPANAMDLALEVGEAARRMGFRGIAGLDIGLREDGQLVIFDPNFRFNSSTTQLLFHRAASDRSGLSVSRSIQVTPAGALSELAGRLHGPIDEGWFVLTRLFDASEHELSGGAHIVTGFVLGDDVEASEAAMARLETILLD